jgi:hypothetical protein
VKQITLVAGAVILASVFIFPDLGAQAQGGAVAVPTQFDVTSVKPAAPGSRFDGAYLIYPGGRFVGINITVARLMQEPLT